VKVVRARLSALDPAFHHAVPDARLRELHDHVGRAQQQRHAHQAGLADEAATRRPGPLRPGRVRHRALDMGNGPMDCLFHRHR